MDILRTWVFSGRVTVTTSWISESSTSVFLDNVSAVGLKTQRTTLSIRLDSSFASSSSSSQPRIVRPEIFCFKSLHWAAGTLVPVRSSRSRFVRSERGEMSRTLVPIRDSHFRFVRPERGEMSWTLVLVRDSRSRFVRPERGEMSWTLVPLRSSHSRLVSWLTLLSSSSFILSLS